MLHFQDPTAPSTRYLQEALLGGFGIASRGAAAFAYATAGGARLLFEDDSFKTFIGEGSLEIIVGVDAVTDTAALAALGDYCSRYPNLLVRAFLHKEVGRTFHPKFSWFRSISGGSLIIGSGNLTRGGLRGNWEAFAELQLSSEQADAVEQSWRDWKILQASRIRELDDPEVIAKAAENKVESAGGRGGAAAAEAEGDLEAPELFHADVLLAEIPSGSTRWYQANFKKQIIEDYFGVLVDSKERVTLTVINDDGTMKEEFSRQVVSVASSNYRFELDSYDRNYPSDGPPIGIFLKRAPRDFVYKIIFPDDARYGDLQTLLTAHNLSKRADHKKWAVILRTVLEDALPGDSLASL